MNAAIKACRWDSTDGNVEAAHKWDEARVVVTACCWRCSHVGRTPRAVEGLRGGYCPPGRLAICSSWLSALTHSRTRALQAVAFYAGSIVSDTNGDDAGTLMYGACEAHNDAHNSRPTRVADLK